MCVHTWAPSRNLCYLSFVILLVDLPLCKRDFSRPTFVYKPGRNIRYIDGWDDGMGWDGMGWDGMGWDGTGWDGWMDGWMDPPIQPSI